MKECRKIAVVGLGYVGLPVAVAFAKKGPVIGYDVDERRIAELRSGHDTNNEVRKVELQDGNILFTIDPATLRQSNFIIITVPTPVDSANKPDLSFLKEASRNVGQHLSKESIVVYESTVYPGVTEDICIPILEQASGLKVRQDFHVGYSPERINPGDSTHTFTNITKVVSAQNCQALDVIAKTYEEVVQAGVYRAPSIKIAEAAKVIENTQRDLNIALMNELAILFHHLEIDTHEVLKTAATKWNFLPFQPGLVGGHCIGVDPHYLTYKAEQVGYSPQVILAGRRINGEMGHYVAREAVKRLLKNKKTVQGVRAIILGLAFKENISDLRNSKVIDIVQELESYGIHVTVHDPVVHPEDALRTYGVPLHDHLTQAGPYGLLILAVAHRQYREMAEAGLLQLMEPDGVIVDVKGVLSRQVIEDAGRTYWRL